MTSFSVKAALVRHFNIDFHELGKYRYQSTKTPCPVYAVNDTEYHTATSSIEKKPRENNAYVWELADSWVTRRYGWAIWVRVNQEYEE